MDPETPEADAVEQSRSAIEDAEDEEAVPSPASDADPGDVAEQQRGIPDEEPYDRG